ncbi:MAG: arginyltransferase [Armatimonadaceae bacterium]
MIVLHRFDVTEDPCFYLPDRVSHLNYEVVLDLSPAEYEERMNRGYRKFGMLVFRPDCPGCQECRPIRILADLFAPNRSQRRALKRNADLQVRYAEPTVDRARLDLYNRYHFWQEHRKNWPPTEKDEEDYRFSFLQNPLPSVEVSVWEGTVLRAVALTELTPNTVSGIYHYHDPDCTDRSLGKFVMLHTIALAQRLGKRYAYFGYYVADCGSLRYKREFRPCEILGTDGIWREEPVLEDTGTPVSVGAAE